MATLWEYESDFIRLIAKIKQRGIKVDAPFCRRKVIEGNRILNNTRDELGWNPGSTTQLGEYLINELKLPVLKRTPAGKPSFDKHALAEYELYLAATGNEVAKKVLRYRGWQKTVSSNFQAYLDLMDENEILHPNYKIHGTVTGRLSCEKPNLQQIPRSSPNEWNGDTKKAFIPRSDGLLLYSFDFKQVEFRLAAAYAGEKELLEVFNAGADVFNAMSDRMGRNRNVIKTFTYATLYGAGRSKTALVLNMPEEEANEFYDDFHGTWPGFRRASERAAKIAANDGYIEYWTGRRRHLSKSDAHKAFNSVIQGGAFEIVKRRMLDVKDEPIVLQVHDDVTFEADGSFDVDQIKKTLEAVPESKELGVKFEVDMKIMGQN